MRVVPFGTASGRPTATRHVSGLGVDFERGWILVDCGEGTQQQVMRSPLKLSRLRLVLLTHLHGDHVLGLPGLLGTIGAEERTAPLQIVGPEGLGDWLDAMQRLPILGVTFPIEVVELSDTTLAGADGPLLQVAAVSGVTVRALPLRHRVPTFGYRIEGPERDGQLDVEAARALGVADGPEMGRLKRGESVMGRNGPVMPDDVLGPERPGLVVTVLGDTTRCEASVTLARDADLLVHETTYSNADAELGEMWKHSTPADASAVAVAAGVTQLMITHFSPRYADESALLEEARAGFADTIAAVELEPVDVHGLSPGSATTS